VLTPTDFPPVAIGASATSGPLDGVGVAIPINLTFSDPDIANSAAPFARITRWPRFGTLHQVLLNGSLGEPILPSTTPLPTVQSYATAVNNVSSQISTCAGCTQYLTCPGCSETLFGAVQVRHFSSPVSTVSS
jgi:hypothetical protein